MYDRQSGELLVRFWVTHRILSGFLTIGWYPILLGREVNKVYCPKIYQNDWRPFPETGPLVLCVPHRPSGYAVSHLFKGEKVNSGTFPCCSENFDPWKLRCCWNLPLYKCLVLSFCYLKSRYSFASCHLRRTFMENILRHEVAVPSFNVVHLRICSFK